MKKCLQSTMIKKHTLTEEQNTRLSQDLVLFNQMKRTSLPTRYRTGRSMDPAGRLSPPICT